MTKMNVAPSLKTKINADDVIVPTGVKQGKKLPAFLNEKIKDVYSTNEIKTNETWIDNKPIYKKVLTATLTNTQATQAVPYNITDADKIWIDQSASYMTNGTVTLPVNWLYGGGREWFRSIVQKNYGNIGLAAHTNFADCTIYLVIKYTKTTD